jgi:hypothetical protein
MAVTITDAIAQLQSMVGGLTGIKEAPVNVTESAQQFPFAIAYPQRGEFHFGDKGWGYSLNEIVLEIHFSRINLPKAIAKSLPYFEQVVDLLLADSNLSGTVQVVESFEFEYGQMEYANVDTIGWMFTLKVKLHRSV